MSARREELTRIAARLFAEQGYQGTSLADLAERARACRSPRSTTTSTSKEDLLWEVAWEGAKAFHAALDAVPADAPATERIRLALRGPPRGRRRPARHRHRLRARVALPRGRAPRARSSPSAAATRSGSASSSARASSGSELRTDLDVPTAALLFLSAANWAYTWLRPGSDTDQLADRLYEALLGRACAGTPRPTVDRQVRIRSPGSATFVDAYCN